MGQNVKEDKVKKLQGKEKGRSRRKKIAEK